MKKIIPFKKDILFKTNLSEITSISLEHTLQIEKDSIVGEFIINGDYKIADNSKNTEEFSFNIPFNINIDDKYILDKVIIDINDFYYEVINNNILSVNIEVLIDKLEEKELIEEELIEEELIKELDLVGSREINNDELENLEIENSYIDAEYNEKEKGNITMPCENEIKEDRKSDIDTTAEVKSLFELFDDSNEEYLAYKVYIVREEDTLETITVKYGITKELLENYNDLKEIKIGDKLIIPAFTNAKG